jgi:hypothetical protein
MSIDNESGNLPMMSLDNGSGALSRPLQSMASIGHEENRQRAKYPRAGSSFSTLT